MKIRPAVQKLRVGLGGQVGSSWEVGLGQVRAGWVVGSGQVVRSGQVASVQVGSGRVGWLGRMVGLGRVGSGGWVGSGWVRLGQVGLGWVRLGQVVGLVFISLSFKFHKNQTCLSLVVMS